MVGKSILDLACGEGLYRRKMKHKGDVRIVGVDISPRMIELARRKEVTEPLGFDCDNYYLSKATYEWAFRTAGFKEIR